MAKYNSYNEKVQYGKSFATEIFPQVTRQSIKCNHHMHMGKVKGLDEVIKTKSRTICDTFEDQIDTYRTSIIDDLNKSLTATDVHLSTQVNKLSEDFHSHCTTIDDCSQVIEQDIASVHIEIARNEGSDTETFTLGDYMIAFEEACKVSKIKLDKLWTEYEDVQKKIMELAVIICNEKVVKIDDDENKNPGFDEQGAVDKKIIWEKAHADIVEKLSKFVASIDKTTGAALKETNDALKASDDKVQKLRETMNGLLHRDG